MRRISLLVLLLLTAVAAGRNVDLSTVPDRDSVQLTIYNSEDLTLVRETRKVTFKKGMNPLQFSWANTLIDPTSVELRFRTSGDKLEVLDTTYPHDKPQMLYWNVKSDLDGEAAIEITYFTSGITWAADYQVVAGRDEATAAVQGFVKVTNRSGEDYENAEVRLVVGTINLVEKIARLAQITPEEFERMDGKDKLRVKREELKKSLDELAPADAALPSTSPAAAKPKQIVKEGLSEYFIYSIEGTETIPHGWSKRLRSLDADAVPVKVQYRYRPAEYGDRLVRMYLMTNNTESKLGTTPLPNGEVHIYRDNGRNGLSYLARQTVKYIPIGDKFELNLGPDPEVVFELIKLRVWRDNLWMQLHGTNVFRRVGDGAVRIQVNSSVVGWDEHAVFTQRIRNYTSKAIDLEVRRSFEGHVLFRSALKPALHDYRTVQFQATVEPAGKADLLFELVTFNGHNAKQNNVTLENAEVKP
jgi:hypothetical protein